MVLELKPGRILAVRLKTGDRIPEDLVEYLKDADLKSGIIIGIGGLKRAVVGFYRKGEYIEEEIVALEGEAVELASLIGNVAVSRGEVTLHLHATLGIRGKVLAGHLIEAEINPTGEVFVLEVKPELKREYEPTTGLRLLKA